MSCWQFNQFENGPADDCHSEFSLNDDSQKRVRVFSEHLRHAVAFQAVDIASPHDTILIDKVNHVRIGERLAAELCRVLVIVAVQID